MLEKPSNGWAIFQPVVNYSFSLSYLDDIPFYWLDAAISGLQTNEPFTVEGHSEPGFTTCTVTDDRWDIHYDCYPYVDDLILGMTKGQFCCRIKTQFLL